MHTDHSQKILILCGAVVMALVISAAATLALYWDQFAGWRVPALVVLSTAFIAGLALVIPAPPDVMVLRALRRMAILFVGCAIVLAGIVMLVTPGPGWVAIFAGLGVLATEFAFARWILRKTRASILRAARAVGMQAMLRRWGYQTGI